MFGNSEEFRQWLVDIRRDLHMHPELANQEKRTQQKVADTLRGLGVEAGLVPDTTGVVGFIPGKEPGRVIGIRADMDALPVEEMTGLPYASQTPGVMHACGHDAHVAILLGVARKLAEGGKEPLPHGVKLIFQPAEESVSGARLMIERGVLQDPPVEVMLACHVNPELPVGEMGIFKDKGYASLDFFDLAIKGKGTHGGLPHTGADPVVAGAAFVTAAQSIVARNVKPTESAVITIGSFQAGNAGNVIPQSAILKGSLRSHDQAVRDLLLRRLEEMAQGLGPAYGVRCELTISQGIPPGRNHPQIAEAVVEVAGELLGSERVSYLDPIMGADDFGLFLREKPGAIMRLGCAHPDARQVTPLHSPHFNLDEAVLEIGVELFLRIIKRLG